MNTIKELEYLRGKLKRGYGFSGSSKFIFGIQEENLKLKLKLKEIEGFIKTKLSKMKKELTFKSQYWAYRNEHLILEKLKKTLEDK